MSTWCARRNMAELKRVLRQPGRRSARMSSLAEMRPAGWWRDFADPRPATAAARALSMRQDFFEAPVLAVFAAERSGNTELEAQIRRRAAAALRRQIERTLRLGYPYSAWNAVIAARQANSFFPTAKGRELQARAESRLRVSREEVVAGWEG